MKITCLKNRLFAASLMISAAHGATIVTEDFSYPNGNLTGNNGGTGNWSGAWQSIGTTGAIASNQYSVTGSGTGGASFWNYRNLNTTFIGSSVDPLYFSATFQKTGADTGYALWLRLGAAGVTTTNPNGPAIGLADNKFSLRLTGAGGAEVNGDFGTYNPGTSGAVQIVGKLEFDISGENENERLTLWVNPTGVETSTLTATITGRDIGWTTPGVAEVGTFVLSGGSAGTIDNLKIGNTWNSVAIPEPGSALLGGLGLLALLRRRR